MYQNNGIISSVNIGLYALFRLVSAVFPFVFNFISFYFFSYCVGLSWCFYFCLLQSISSFLLKMSVVTVVCEKVSVLILLYFIYSIALLKVLTSFCFFSFLFFV